MNFHFNEEEQEILDMLHDFCLKEVAPKAAEVDENERFPEETWHKLSEMGMMGVPFPEEYGGGGIDYVTVAAVMEEFAKYDLGYATTLMGTTLSLKPVLMHGTPEQKKMYAGVIVGGGLGAFALTEAGAGSDAAACRTTAVRDGDEYVINGTKCFITNSTYADIFVVFASTNREAGVKGLSAFIVERDRPGFSVDKHEDKMGIRTSDTASLVFDNVRIPADHLLGKEGEGFKYAMQTLDLARPFVAASAVGVAQRAVDEAVKYAKERICFGKPIAKLQAIQFMLADMETKLNAARGLVYNAAWMMDNGEKADKAASMAKYYAAEAAIDIVNKALQLFGGYGYSREYAIERIYRDVRVCSIYEGSSQVQQIVISGQMLK